MSVHCVYVCVCVCLTHRTIRAPSISLVTKLLPPCFALSCCGVVEIESLHEKWVLYCATEVCFWVLRHLRRALRGWGYHDC